MPPCRAMKDLCLTCVQPSTNRKSDLTYIQEDLSYVRSSGSGSEYEDHKSRQWCDATITEISSAASSTWACCDVWVRWMLTWAPR